MTADCPVTAAQNVTTGLLVVLETLSPLERAAFAARAGGSLADLPAVLSRLYALVSPDKPAILAVPDR